MKLSDVIDNLMIDHGYTRDRAKEAVRDHANIIDGMRGVGRNARDTADRIAEAVCPRITEHDIQAALDFGRTAEQHLRG